MDQLGLGPGATALMWMEPVAGLGQARPRIRDTGGSWHHLLGVATARLSCDEVRGHPEAQSVLYTAGRQQLQTPSAGSSVELWVGTAVSPALGLVGSMSCSGAAPAAPARDGSHGCRAGQGMAQGDLGWVGGGGARLMAPMNLRLPLQ